MHAYHAGTKLEVENTVTDGGAANIAAASGVGAHKPAGAEQPGLRGRGQLAGAMGGAVQKRRAAAVWRQQALPGELPPHLCC